MSRIILTFILLVFSVGAANASVLMTCCPKQQNLIQKSEAQPCHGHHQKSKPIHEKNTSSCLCAYTCVAKISLIDMNFSDDFVSTNKIPAFWTNDFFASIIIRPESPPPKA
jgi:hypothetical protein